MNLRIGFVHWIIWSLLGLVVVSVAGVFVSTLIRPRVEPLPVFGQMPEFVLTNQFNHPVGLNDLKGHIVVADIIFTRCPGPCMQMTRKLRQIQERLPASSAVKLVSLSADPVFDTPAVLNEYAAKFKADSNTWQFLTGPKQAVYDLAMKGLKLAVDENPGGKVEEDRFIHSTRLVLMDRAGQLRGISFDGTEREVVSAVLRAIEQLQNEERNESAGPARG